LSNTCADPISSSNCAIDARCAWLSGWPCAWPVVASLAWVCSSPTTGAPGTTSRPSHITVLSNLRFAVGSGRRNSDSSAALANLYGSSTAISSNSAVAGIGSPTRTSPLVSSMLYACRRLALVDTSALGEFDPSLVRNTADSPSPSSYAPPSVSSNVSCSCLGVIVQPAVGTWQLTQRRPLVPRSWKNSFSRSMKPRELTVVNTPVASCTGTLLAIRLWLSQCRAVTSSNVLAASPSNVLTRSSSLLAVLASGLAESAWVSDTSAAGA